MGILIFPVSEQSTRQAKVLDASRTPLQIGPDSSILLRRCIPGVAARVRDNDGEFMLIEGAYALPRWLKPETASNRVWLLNGLMHIVPLPTAAAPDLPSFPSLKQAKQIVQGSQVNTTAGSDPCASCQYHTSLHCRLAMLKGHLLASVLFLSSSLQSYGRGGLYTDNCCTSQGSSCRRRWLPG